MSRARFHNRDTKVYRTQKKLILNMENKRLLRIRRVKKKKKPAFLRQEWFKKKAVGMKWRRPRGRTSKLRIEEGARGKRPGPGYRSPIAVRGSNRAGLMEVRITHMKELDCID